MTHGTALQLGSLKMSVEHDGEFLTSYLATAIDHNLRNLLKNINLSLGVDISITRDVQPNSTTTVISLERKKTPEKNGQM